MKEAFLLVECKTDAQTGEKFTPLHDPIRKINEEHSKLLYTL